MFEELKPLLYYEYCERCRECCVFRDPEGVWTPRVTPSEAEELGRVSGRGAAILSAPDRLKIVPSGEGNQCVALDRAAYRCTVYPSRPFECRLYPFLLSTEKDGVKLYAHLSCPYVQEKMHGREWADYMVTLRAFFSRADVRRYCLESRGIFPDYTGFGEQLVSLFDVRTTFPERLLQERPRFETFADQGERTVSARAFANLFVWQDAFDLHFEEIDGILAVYAEQPVGTFLLSPPLGKSVSAGAIERIFDRMRMLNRGGSLGRIENVSRSECAMFDPARYICAERASEYIYRREDIAGLKGQALKSKRHDVNLIERSVTPVFRRYAASDREACLRLFERWLDRKLGVPDDGGDILPRLMLADARGVHAQLWDFADALGLEGRVIEVDGQVVAYTFGCRLNDETFCVLAEVADPDIAGLASFIFRAFADDEAVRPYRWLNTMDDYGLSALARAKKSWRPARLEPVYTVIRKEEAC